MTNSLNDAMAYRNTKSLLLELIGDKETIKAQQTQLNELKEKYVILKTYNNKLINNYRCPNHNVCANIGTHGCEIIGFDSYCHTYEGEEFKFCCICDSFICDTCAKKSECKNCLFLICKNCKFDESQRQDYLESECDECTESNYYWNYLKKYSKRKPSFETRSIL